MRFLKRFLRILLFSLLVVLVFGAAAVATLTLTSPGRALLASEASALASAPGRGVRLSGLSGIWSGALRLDEVAVADDKGTWLVARDVALDWSPGALLASRFEAQRLAARRVEIARTPQAQPAAKSSEPFSLPLSVDVRSIDLPDIALGPELAGGRVASVAARSSAMAEKDPLAVKAELKLARTDGPAGSLDATVHFAPAENVLDVDVKASEPAGGILASLLRLPGAPRVDIVVSGSRDAQSWKGKGTFSVDGRLIASASGTQRFTADGSVVEASGQGDFSSFVPYRFQAVLAGTTSFDVAGTLTANGGVRIDRAMVDGTALDAKATGALDPDGKNDLAVELSAKAGGLPLSFGTEESPIELTIKAASLHVVGQGKQPALDVSASLAKAATKTVTLTDMGITLHSDGFDLQARVGPVSGALTAAALIVDSPAISPLVSGAVKAELRGALSTDTLAVEAGSFRTDAVDGGFNGHVSLADGAITLELKADVLSSALPAPARPLLDAHTLVTARLERDAEGHVSASALALQSGGFSAGGAVKLLDGAVDATLHGKLAEVKILAPQAAGALDFEASAKGPLGAPDVVFTVRSDRLDVAGRTITALDLTASGKADIANPTAQLSLKGMVGEAPLTASGVVGTADGRRQVRDLALSLGANRISGALDLDEAMRPLGTIDFDLPDIGPLAALALQSAEGDLAGSAVFSVDADRPQLKLSARSKHLARADVAAEGVSVEATVADYLGSPAVAGTVKAAAVRSGKTDIRGVAATLSRDGQWTRFDGAATVAGTPVRAAGRVAVKDGVTTVELASAEATFRGIKAALARAATVTVRDGTARFDRLALNAAGGSVTVSGSAGARLDLTADLSGLPASLANGFAPGLDAGGTLSGTVKAAGPAASPTVTYDIAWQGGQTSQTRAAGFGPMSVRSSGTYAGNALKFQATVGDGSGLTLKGGGSVGLAGAPQLDLDFDGAVPFGFLTERLAAQGLALSGTSNVTLRVRGAASAPQVEGSVRASGARFVDARSGIAVNGIVADIALGSGRASITRLTGSLSGGGTLSASGTVGLDAGQGFPADLAIKIADARYTDGQVVTTTASGDLSVKGPLVTAPRLGGTINLARTVITVPDRLPTSLSKLDVKHKNAPAAVKAQQKALKPARSTGGSGGGLTLDLTVNAPQQIYVQGRGLDAELGGSLHLVGPLAAPQANGEFTLRRGRLALLGRSLTFTRGTLGFTGSLVPTLDFAAETAASDATVVVTVSGEANDPAFSFTSTPALPQDEVLARLVFGRALSGLSALQVAQLADAAAELAGAGGSSSLLNSLRGKLGVDSLDIRTTDTGDTAISAGKYLNQRTYVTIEKGSKAGSGKARIDLDVGKGVKLRGEASDDGEAKGGIFFEREY